MENIYWRRSWLETRNENKKSTIVCSQRSTSSWTSMILNDEVSSNSVVKRVTKHFTVLINVPKEKQKMKNHLKPSIWGGLLPVPSGRSQTHLRHKKNEKCRLSWKEFIFETRQRNKDISFNHCNLVGHTISCSMDYVRHQDPGCNDHWIALWRPLVHGVPWRLRLWWVFI